MACSSSYYSDYLGNCLPCDPKCYSCVDSPTNCKECNLNYYLNTGTNKCGKIIISELIYTYRNYMSCCHIP
jgi:hypothetical protein